MRRRRQHEYWPGSVTGPLSVELAAAWTNVAVGFAVDFRALIEGRATGSAWDFGDGVVVSNRPYASHAWTAPGNYTVILRAYNETHPAGVSITGTVQVAAQPVHHVAVDSANPVPPYTSWATAARNIQDAVDAAMIPGALVLVSNGVYATGGRAVGTNELVNRVAMDKPVALQSVHGPALTIIGGGGSNRCVHLASGASLSGFTLANGATLDADEWPTPPDPCGGGVWCESVSVVVTNCTLSGDSAGDGGGAYGGTLNNCTLTGNSAYVGGGAAGCTLYNCIVQFNAASEGPNYVDSTLQYSGTTPLPDAVGNIDGDPCFVNAAAGVFHLQSNSPCINAGNNAYVTASTDLDGLRRLVGGTVDIGAYDYQGPGSTISCAWLQRYGLPTDGSTDAADPDADGMNTWQEWRCQTDPTNVLSVLRLLLATPAGTNVLVRWPSVEGVNYFLERSTDLGASTPLAARLLGPTGTNTFTDANAAALPTVFAASVSIRRDKPSGGDPCNWPTRLFAQN